MRGLKITPAAFIAGMVVIMLIFIFKDELTDFVSYLLELVYNELFRDSARGLKTLQYNVFKG